MKKLTAILILIILLFSTVAYGVADPNIFVTPAGAGTKDGTTWEKAMGLAEFCTDVNGGAESGDIYYVSAGTYTFSVTDRFEAWLRDGASTNVITIIGVESGLSGSADPNVSNWVYGTDRPYFDMNEVGESVDITSDLGDYWVIRNIRMDCNDSNGFQAGTYVTVDNSKFQNTSATGNRYALTMGQNATIQNCEAISSSGRCIITGNYSTTIGCYMHDSTHGIYRPGHGMVAVGNVFDTCSTAGLDVGSGDNHKVINNTFYNCAIGIYGSDSVGGVFFNNIFDVGAKGAEWTTEEKSNQWDFNIWDAGATDVTLVTKGAHAVDGDPGLGDPANGDFTLGSGSNSIDAGIQVGTNEGVTGDYKVNAGADQDDVASGGGLPVIGGSVVR